jgi:hypothetical protein
VSLQIRLSSRSAYGLNSSVFGIFRAEVRVIDHAKRATLSRLLLDNVMSTAPGERLDEKLASLTFSDYAIERESAVQLSVCY